MADLWAETFGAQAGTRLVRVIGVQTDWPGFETAALEAPLAVARGARPPAESFDAYAVTGYVGHDVASDDNLEALRRDIARGRAEERALETLRADAADLVDRLWPHHARVAARHGLRLVMYEGGPHMVAGAAGREDEAITGFLTTMLPKSSGRCSTGGPGSAARRPPPISTSPPPRAGAAGARCAISTTPRRVGMR